MRVRFLQQFVLAAIGVAISVNAGAQPSGHAGHRQAGDITGIAARTETVPMDDAVLAQAPGQLRLQFPERVRLVKLTLRNQSRDWVDIDFRYDPRAAQQFLWQLPALVQSQYYIVDWAALDRQERLVRGSFSFAFGVDAEPPSVARAAEEELLQQRYGDPNIRYVAPPSTQIIINRDPPRYDPPFTIDLADPPETDGQNPDNP